MAERKSLSKKTRFEVFKRDSFKCQYCGRTAPDVTLHVDHVKPVAEGGTNDIMNLVTACFECNLGKGARELSDDSAIKAQRNQLEELQERREQIEMMYEWQCGLAHEWDDKVDFAERLIVEIAGVGCTDSGRADLRKLINEFGFDERENPGYDPAARPMSLFDTTRELTRLKREALDEEGRPWLKAADSSALVFSLRNLDAAPGEGGIRLPRRKARRRR